MTNKKRTRLSKFLSFILRHHPEKVGLTLEPGGWVGIDALIAAVNQKNDLFLNRERLKELIEKSKKPRFTVDPTKTRIRAAYGHSVAVDLQMAPEEPPEQLYHGTAQRFIASIREEGLRSKSRNFVHLSTFQEDAAEVGQRHGQLVLLTVEARALYRTGQVFYRPNNRVWLTEQVPAAYLSGF